MPQDSHDIIQCTYILITHMRPCSCHMNPWPTLQEQAHEYLYDNMTGAWLLIYCSCYSVIEASQETSYQTDHVSGAGRKHCCLHHSANTRTAAAVHM